MISTKVRMRILDRSDARCEGMVEYKPGLWSRCWGKPVEIHHMLTRARGGGILDEIEETYHLIALCPDCHRQADGEIAYAGELLIDGYITTTPEGKPKYQGSDTYLKEKYG